MARDLDEEARREAAKLLSSHDRNDAIAEARESALPSDVRDRVLEQLQQMGN